MFGFAGVVRHAGPARDDVAGVRQMLSRLAVPSGETVAAGAALLGTGPGGLARSADGSVWVSFDGRLDNARELERSLGVVASSLSDAQLVCEAIARNPSDVPGAIARLLGDFAGAAWWPAESRLVLFRDALGMRPLLHAQADGRVWWATTLTAMLEPEWLPRILNEGYLAEYLADAPASLTETPIIGIHRVPAANMVEWRASWGHARATRYWDPTTPEPVNVELRVATETLRSLLDDAVRVRLISQRPPSFQLSGGLDSSTVVTRAAALSGERPSTFSIVFPDLTAADESAFIGDLERAVNARPHRVPYRPARGLGLSAFRHEVSAGELPGLPTGEFMMGPLLEAAVAEKHHVMLTGLGGDDWLTGSLFQTTDLIRSGRFVDAWRFSRDYRAIEFFDPGVWIALRSAVVPLLPEWFKRHMRQMRQPRTRPWIRPEFAARTQVADRLRQTYDRIPPLRSHVLRESLAHLWSADSVRIREANHRLSVLHGIELRHPFFDRRLVEFLVTLPDDLRFRSGEHRFLLRRMMADQLPASIGARLGKQVFEQVVLDALHALEPDRLFEQPLEVVERGWVDLDVLRRMWEGTRHGHPGRDWPDDPGLFTLWQAFGTEALVRALLLRDR